MEPVLSFEIKVWIESPGHWCAEAFIGRGVTISRTGSTPGEAATRVAEGTARYPENFSGALQGSA